MAEGFPFPVTANLKISGNKLTMKYIMTLLIATLFFSCRGHRDKFDYETSIASKVYEAQLKYLDYTIYDYARISKQGYYYYQESAYLDKTAEELKDKIKNYGVISENDKADFYGHFERTFTNHGLIDLNTLNQLKELPIKTVSDIDILKLYIKNNYVCILLNNKLLPFDTWGAMVSSNAYTIKQGEEFQADLATIASSSQQPTEWFLLKNNNNSITNENIIDTLHPDRFGVVSYKTKTYKKGENRLVFISRLNTPRTKSNTLTKEISFYVK
jgi:hypothetical protein